MKRKKQSLDNQVFSVCVTGLLLAITALCVVPFLYLFAVSLSGPGPVQRGEVFLVPREPTLGVYYSIFCNGAYLRAMVRTLLLTVLYVGISMTLTILCAYPLSEPGLPGKKILFPLILFTMYFSGGLIPSYLLVNGLGLIDSYLALILPCALSTYNMIVMRSFFMGVPVSLREAARMDGAGDFKILCRVVLPVSKPVLATVALFYAVARWNALQDALLYINDPNKKVLQICLKQMIQTTEGINEITAEMEVRPVLQTVRAGALIFSLVPVLVVYPFLQKYFVKGTTIGSVKG